MGISGKKFRAALPGIAIGLLFMFGVAPILLAAIGLQSSETFSIYNTSEDGLSEVRRELESTIGSGGQLKYNVTSLVSNLNALNRFDGSGVLVILGPSANFDESEFISLLLYLLRGGSLVIVDDFGSGNQVLEPLFKAFEAWDNTVRYVRENFPDVPLPTMNDIMTGNDTGDFEVPIGEEDGGGQFQDVADQGDFAGGILNLIGNSIKRFGFNGSVLMDLTSNNGNPNRPTIIDVDQTGGPFSFTQGVRRVQTEMPSIISFLVNDTTQVESGVLAWKPLTKLTLSFGGGELGDVGGESDIMRALDFLFPLYSSKLSWIETDIRAAAENRAEPDLDEWGNDAFSLALNLPIFPGGGKLVFIADTSIFINRWTQQIAQNDNLILITNLIKMTTDHHEGNNIPVIFDFGHVHQGLLSPSLYSTTLLKLIANMSMFPLLAPLLPITVFAFGKRLIPEQRRLRPILLTKRRGGRGASEFDKKIKEVTENSTYGEPINYLAKKLVRTLRSDARFDGGLVDVKNAEVISEFYTENFKGRFNKRELRSSLGSIFRIAEMPHRPIPGPVGKQYLLLLKELIQILE
jgi:hypothetical protein